MLTTLFRLPKFERSLKKKNCVREQLTVRNLKYIGLNKVFIQLQRQVRGLEF